MNHGCINLHVSQEMLHPCNSGATVATDKEVSKQELFRRIYLQSAVPGAAAVRHYASTVSLQHTFLRCYTRKKLCF